LKAKYYVLFIVGNLEAELVGPFESAQERDEKAKVLWEVSDDNGVHALDQDSEGELSVWDYSGGFFDGNEKED